MKYFLTALTLFLAPILTFAHGSGASIEVLVDEYLLDVGYSPEIVAEGTQVRFDFDILDSESREPKEFDDIWLRIEKAEQVLFAGGLSKQRFGATGITYSFVEPGDYKIFVRFANEGKSLAETTFDFPVVDVPEEAVFFQMPIVQKLILLLIGAIVGVLFMSFRPKKRSLV